LIGHKNGSGQQAMTTKKTIEILLVEDSQADARLIIESFRDASVPCHVSHVRDGDKALAFLHRGVEFADAPRPDLILLDLNLPTVSGLEVLEAAKGHQDLKSIPVIVLTASAIEEDVHRAYDLQASCYLSKPVDLDGFSDLVRTIEEYWLRHVRLPVDTSDSEARSSS
jgi:CheY-like chemotaxis protein